MLQPPSIGSFFLTAIIAASITALSADSYNAKGVASVCSGDGGTDTTPIGHGR